MAPPWRPVSHRVRAPCRHGRGRRLRGPGPGHAPGQPGTGTAGMEPRWLDGQLRLEAGPSSDR
eukprot:4977274-Alexandrium_andersonii.AAC.1